MSLDFTVLFYFSIFMLQLYLFCNSVHDNWAPTVIWISHPHCMYTFCREMGYQLHVFPAPPHLLLGDEWQNYAMILKDFFLKKKKSMHAILYPNVLFLSVHKLMLVSFILCIELITFDSIFCTVSSLSLFIKFYLALIDCNIFFLPFTAFM